MTVPQGIWSSIPLEHSLIRWARQGLPLDTGLERMIAAGDELSILIEEALRTQSYDDLFTISEEQSQRMVSIAKKEFEGVLYLHGYLATQ